MHSLITYGSSHLSLGMWIGLPLLILLVLLCVGSAVIGVAIWREDGPFWFAGSVAALLAVLLAGAFFFFPFKGEYHHWQNISGTVTSTNSRFLASNTKGGGTDQKFVVTFDGSGQQFGCNDTRCATVRKGDHLTITCKRSWQWFGTPGYDCNFVSMEAAR